MGLLIGLILTVGVLSALEIIKEKYREDKEKKDIINVIQCVFGIILFVIILAFLLIPEEPKNEKYSKETLVETIELEEIEENIYINYSYSTKEYSYILDSEVQTISENCLVLEEESDVKSPQLVHYELSEPENFWISYLPWITLDKYIIYVPDKEMIGRTN